MTIYKIENEELVKDFFQDLPDGERPWEIWSEDPHNSFVGGPEDLSLFVELTQDYAGWVLSTTGDIGCQPLTPDDRDGVVEWLEKNGILWNPEYEYE